MKKGLITMIMGQKATASRTMKVSAVAVAAALALSACGGGNSGGGASGPSAAQEGELKTSMNPQTVDKLDQGGTLQLSIDSIGPDFNTFSANGNSMTNNDMQDTFNQARVFKMKADGEPELDKNYMEDAKSEVKDGKQVITYTFRKDAKFNDGTPMDYKVIENMAKVLSGQNKDYALVSTAGYEDIEKVEKGASDNIAVVTMKKEFYPWQDMFSASYGPGLFHPAINTPEIFNNGLTKLHPEWYAGPFKVGTFDESAKTLSVVPNDKWWGEKPVLAKVIYRTMESTAEISAFKNGEIDAVAAANLNRYQQAKTAQNADERRGQRLSVFGIVFNAKSESPIKNLEVRKAIWQATNRDQMRDVRYKGLNWKETAPGSWMSMPFSPLYEDNMPVKFSTEDATKTLEAAGWAKGSDGIYAKDGKKLSIKLTNFGQDPTQTALAQTYQAQMKAVGIDLKIDNRGESQFNDTMAKKNFETIMMGYTVGPDPTNAPKQFYKTGGENISGTGTAEVDKMIEDFTLTDNAQDRAKKANAIEKKAMEQYGMLPMWNGPVINFYRKGLANYGPRLYQTVDWTTVGFEKGSTHK